MKTETYTVECVLDEISKRDLADPELRETVTFSLASRALGRLVARHAAVEEKEDRLVVSVTVVT